jgi:hypothetical protein
MTATELRRTPLLLAALLVLAPRGHAAEIDLFPGHSFEEAVEALTPGDTLIVHAGTYADAGRISIGVRGTAAAPVLIKGADGEALPLITRNAGAPVQNTINIEGATWLRLTRLEITGNGGDAINMSGTPSFITLDNLEIHDVDVGINFRSSMNDITVRHNHIHHTGKDGGTGEGMYVGCNDATCVVSRALIENNWIHDTQNSTQGDGIEVKHGSHSNIVRDNVIYNTGYPCVLVYGTVGQPVNVVEGNVMWNCGDSGIQAAADAIIRNNIILDGPGNGFNSQPHQAATPSNLQFVHNTVVGGSPCLRLSGWSGRPGLVLANNAIYCDADDFAIGGLSGVTVTGNVVTPATSALPAAGYRVGQTATLDLTDVAQHNVYPRAGSRVIDAASAAHVTSLDFNGNARSGTPDAGAYDYTTAQNPGWAVVAGFKNASAQPQPPDLALSANPLSVAVGGGTQINWNATSATACTASASPATSGWSGTKGPTGSEGISGLAATTQFNLSCSNAAGSTSRSVTVTVVAAPAPTVSLAASPATLAAGERSTLTWSSTNATGCTATGAWAGNKASAGNEQSAALATTSTFTLACTGGGGSAERSVTVTVTTGGGTPPPASGGGDGGGGGGGAVGWPLLGALLGLAARRRRRS